MALLIAANQRNALPDSSLDQILDQAAQRPRHRIDCGIALTHFRKAYRHRPNQLGVGDARLVSAIRRVPS